MFHPPLTNTASSSGLPVPKEFMASPEKVGEGLAKRIASKKIRYLSFLQSGYANEILLSSPFVYGQDDVENDNTVRTDQ